MLAAALLGPGIAWYLGVAAFLFGIGALGVLIRRNPLIVLLSLEIMLNSANLALIGFLKTCFSVTPKPLSVFGTTAISGSAPPGTRSRER